MWFHINREIYVASHCMYLNKKIFQLLQLATNGRYNQNNMVNNCHLFFPIVSNMANPDGPPPLAPIKVPVDNLWWMWLWSIDLIHIDHPLNNNSIVTVEKVEGGKVSFQVDTLLSVPKVKHPGGGYIHCSDTIWKRGDCKFEDDGKGFGFSWTGYG